MRAVLCLTLLLSVASCTAPGATDEDAKSSPSFHACGRAGDPAMVRPYEPDDRTQAERDRALIGREPAPAEEPDAQ